MKTISIVLLLSIVLLSCRNNDNLSSMVINMSQNELNHYNHIRRMTNDTNVINYIDSITKDNMQIACESKGMLVSANTYLNPMDSSIKKINIYIDSLKK